MNKELFTRQGRPLSTVDTVISMIKDLLVRKHLRPGDMIPSENELSQSLSISRGSIREAMKILSAFGVVDIRQGDGTYISTSVNRKLFDPLLFNLLVSEPEVDELAELRILMEAGIVKLVVRHAGDEDIRRLEEAYLVMEDLNARGVTDHQELFDADLQFHAVLGEISGNRLVRSVYSFVAELFAPTMHPGHGLETHRRIVDALYARDANAAVAAVEEHDATWKALILEERTVSEGTR